MATFALAGHAGVQGSGGRLRTARQCDDLTSQFNGETQTVWMPGSRWVCTFTFGNHVHTDRAAIEGFLAGLEGQYHRISMGHPRRTEPRGTMRGSPTLNGTAVQGARVLNILGTGTLLAGDMLGVGGQLVMVTADATSALSAVAITPPLRAQANVGAAVTWSAPKTLWVPSTNEILVPYEHKIAPRFAVQLVEVFN